MSTELVRTSKALAPLERVIRRFPINAVLVALAVGAATELPIYGIARG